MKSRGLEEIPVFDISEKAVNGVESKPLSADEEKLASGMLAKHDRCFWKTNFLEKNLTYFTLLQLRKILMFIFRIYTFLPCMYLYALDPLELELETIVICHVDAGRILVFWKNKFLSSETSLQPNTLFYFDYDC